MSSYGNRDATRGQPGVVPSRFPFSQHRVAELAKQEGSFLRVPYCAIRLKFHAADFGDADHVVRAKPITQFGRWRSPVRTMAIMSCFRNHFPVTFDELKQDVPAYVLISLKSGSRCTPYRTPVALHVGQPVHGMSDTIGAKRR